MQKKVLRDLIERAKDHSSLAAVFDLDSTLFNVAPRITAIYQAFARDFAEKHPNEAKVLEKAEQLFHDWGIQPTLDRIGLAQSPQDFHEDLQQFWNDKFHSGEFLHHDLPIPGAIDYVNQLHEQGSKIIYLTGRDVHRYQPETKTILGKTGFPVDSDQVILALKPDKSMNDAKFKLDYLRGLTHKFSEIWFFDNEAVNVNLVAQNLPLIKTILFDSTHSGKEEPLETLLRIKDFLHE